MRIADENREVSIVLSKKQSFGNNTAIFPDNRDR
jgi:hypothetical protein